MSNEAKDFYESVFSQPYENTGFAWPEAPEAHPFYGELKDFIENHGLADADKRCLEVGIGRGSFQNLVPSYVGIDIALSVGRLMRAPFAAADASRLPFPTGVFDAVWTNYVLEHVVKPEDMLREIWRVLKPGGFLFLSAAWQCGSWLAEGYPVRPYSDFDWKGKLVKASVPIRDSVLFRSLRIFPLRLRRIIAHRFSRQPTQFRYGELTANYEKNWMPDATAVNSMDPFEVYYWYVSRGATCLNYPSLLAGFFMRTGVLTFQMPA